MWLTHRKMNNWVIILGREKNKQLFIPVIFMIIYGNIPVDCYLYRYKLNTAYNIITD